MAIVWNCMEKKCKKAKWLSEEALPIAVKRREAKSKGEKERYTHLNAEFQRIAAAAAAKSLQLYPTLCEPREFVMDRMAWCATIHGLQRVGHE